MINWHVANRVNVHTKEGKEWALYAIDDITSIRYVLFTWSKKPSKEKVKITIAQLIHAMRFGYAIQQKPEPSLDWALEIKNLK